MKTKLTLLSLPATILIFGVFWLGHERAFSMITALGAVLQKMTPAPSSFLQAAGAALVLTLVTFLGAFAVEQSSAKKPARGKGPVMLGCVVVMAALSIISLLLHAVAGRFQTPDLPATLTLPIFLASVYAALRSVVDVSFAPKREPLLRGVEVLREPRRALKAFQQLSDDQGARGIALSADLKLPLHQETKHVLLVAAPGGGKTQVIYPLIEAVRQRGDPILLYDFKGDFTAAFGEERGTLILSPFDARGAAWDVAGDVDTEMRALEFARSLIPDADSKEPFFRRAAQDLLTGVVQKLQREKPRAWNFADLVRLLQTKEEIVSAALRYRPAALQALGPVDGKQAASVLGELRAGTIQLDYLARAWSETLTKVSLKAWVTGDATARSQLIIIKGHQEYRTLAGFLTAQIFAVLIKSVLALPESSERRLWAFMDEFGNIPRIDGLSELLTAVRSKGLRVVCALQSVAQVEAIYGDAFTKTFFDSFGTKLAGLCGGATARYLSDDFGKIQVERTLRSESIAAGGGKNGRSKTRTKGQTVVVESALLDSDFSTLAPPSLSEPATFWVKVQGWPVGKLLFPVEKMPERCRDFIEPKWLAASSPAEAETPPKEKISPPSSVADSWRGRAPDLSRDSAGASAKWDVLRSTSVTLLVNDTDQEREHDD